MKLILAEVFIFQTFLIFFKYYIHVVQRVSYIFIIESNFN